MKLFWSPEYVGGEFETVAKSAKVASLVQGRVEVVPPDPIVNWNQFLDCLSPEYREALVTGHPRALASSSGLDWSPAYRSSIFASTSGMLRAAQHAFVEKEHAGSASSGLHHARADHGSGFCAINGLAVAAEGVLDLGARRVFIIDVDAHFGGGTWSILEVEERVDVLDVAVDNFDRYDTSGRPGWTARFVPNSALYLDTIFDNLPRVARYDLIIYNAGMDPWEDCYIGGLKGITADVLLQRDQMVFDWADRLGIPVAFCFAGGYGDLAKIATLHARTVLTAASIPATV